MQKRQKEKRQLKKTKVLALTPTLSFMVFLFYVISSLCYSPLDVCFVDVQYNIYLFVCHAIIHDTKMSELVAPHETDGNNLETKKEEVVSKRNM